MNLPNKLTMLRIFLMPVMLVLFYLELYIAAATVFLLAAFTDMLDGKIARKYNLVTVFGKFVDPLADKLINLAAIVILASQIRVDAPSSWYGIFAVIGAVIIVAREVIITSLRALAANEGVVIAADKMGKLKTVVQDVAIVAMMIDETSYFDGTFAMELIHWIGVCTFVLAVILTIASGINYFVSNKEIMNKIKENI